MPIHVLSMSQVCQVILFRPSNEIQLEIALLSEFCIPQHSVHRAQQDLFATSARADSSFALGLGWGRRRRRLLRAGGPRRRVGYWRAGRRRAGLLVGGVRRGGSAGVWGFLGVLDSARAHGAVTPLAPAKPSTPSQYCKEVEFGAKTAFRKVDAHDHDFLAATVHPRH